jgi:hypothetical protein
MARRAFIGYGFREIPVSVLVGKTLTRFDVHRGEDLDEDRIDIVTSDGLHFKMAHERDCRESVNIEDVVGEPEHLLGMPILIAELATSSELGPPRDEQDKDRSWTWSFYKFSTNRGSVTIRWFGNSNGYYSEEVSFAIVDSEYERL